MLIRLYGCSEGPRILKPVYKSVIASNTIEVAVIVVFQRGRATAGLRHLDCRLGGVLAATYRNMAASSDIHRQLHILPYMRCLLWIPLMKSSVTSKGPDAEQIEELL